MPSQATTRPGGAQAVGAGALGRWVLGVRGRAGGRCRQLGARAQGAAGVRSWQARDRLGERQQARGHGMDARGLAAGAGRGARGGRLGGQCAPGCAQLG